MMRRRLLNIEDKKINLAENATYTGWYGIDYTDGNVKAGNPYRYTSYIDISGCNRIKYSRLYSSYSSNIMGIAFYDDTQTYISGINSIYSQSTSSFILTEIPVPPNAKYIRLTAMRQGNLAGVPVEVYKVN